MATKRRASKLDLVGDLARRRLVRIGKQAGRRADRALHSFVNGMDWFLSDAEAHVGGTPWRACLEQDKLTVRAYDPPANGTDWGLGATVESDRDNLPPVMLIPPLMVKPYIFDLTEQRSLVQHLLQLGHSVYLVDFGEPDATDRNVTLSDYVVRWVPAAVDAARQDSGCDDLFMMGYCMGGLFALMYCATTPSPPVRGVVTIASPFDSHKMGVLSALAQIFHREVDFVSRHLGNVPGSLSSSMFKMMNPLKQVTRYADLFFNLYDEQYVRGFEALSAWTDNFIDYPQQAFRDVFQQFIVDNEFKGQGITLTSSKGESQLARLRDVAIPLLAFAGESDDVVHPAAVRELPDLVSSTDVTVRMAPGGHMGVFAGRNAPRSVWEPASTWIRERC